MVDEIKTAHIRRFIVFVFWPQDVLCNTAKTGVCYCRQPQKTSYRFFPDEPRPLAPPVLDYKSDLAEGLHDGRCCTESQSEDLYNGAWLSKCQAHIRLWHRIRDTNVCEVCSKRLRQ